MTEQELKNESEVYRGMYYTLYNAIDDVIETTLNGYIKEILVSAKYRSRDILLGYRKPHITRMECVDVLNRLIAGMLNGVVPADTDFIDMCISKCPEWQDTEFENKDEYKGTFDNLIRKVKEAENEKPDADKQNNDYSVAEW